MWLLPLHCFHRTFLIAITAMQAVVLVYHIWFSILNTSLRAMFLTSPAPDTGICNNVSFFFYFHIPKCIRIPEDGIYTQMKIFDFCPVDAKNNSYISCISWIYICQIWMFFKYLFTPFYLFIFFHRICISRQPDHFFIFCITDFQKMSVFLRRHAGVHFSSSWHIPRKCEDLNFRFYYLINNFRYLFHICLRYRAHNDTLDSCRLRQPIFSSVRSKLPGFLNQS